MIKNSRIIYLSLIVCNILALADVGVFFWMVTHGYKAGLSHRLIMMAPWIGSIILFIYNIRLCIKKGYDKLLAFLLPFHLFGNPIISILLLKKTSHKDNKTALRKKQVKEDSKTIATLTLKLYKAGCLITVIFDIYLTAGTIIEILHVWPFGGFVQIWILAPLIVVAYITLSITMNISRIHDEPKYGVFLLYLNFFYLPFYSRKVIRNGWIGQKGNNETI